MLLDVVDAALTRLVELLERRPQLLGSLASASHSASNVTSRAGRYRLDALLELRADPHVRDACTVHLSLEDAVQLATEIIAAASPDHSPGRSRVSVSGRGKNETTDHRKDVR